MSVAGISSLNSFTSLNSSSATGSNSSAGSSGNTRELENEIKRIEGEIRAEQQSNDEPQVKAQKIMALQTELQQIQAKLLQNSTASTASTPNSSNLVDVTV
ncbi:MAG: hypothetical protein VB084_14655 [Syntrophomonadaceae bacterium]|nr:hypothetical protein [Syntrophomonadaceae bacterium]